MCDAVALNEFKNKTKCLSNILHKSYIVLILLSHADQGSYLSATWFAGNSLKNMLYSSVSCQLPQRKR